MTNNLPQINNMEISSFKFTARGLEPIGTPSLEDWLSCGQRLRFLKGAIHFLIGDWLVYGEMRFGETYRQAVEATGFDVQTLRADKWVALRIPPERRQEQLSFAHHKEVADMDEEDQEELLAQAVEKKLTRDQFKKFINKQEFREEQPKPVISPFRKAIHSGEAFIESLHTLAGTQLSPDEYDELRELLQEIGNATKNISYEAAND